MSTTSSTTGLHFRLRSLILLVALVGSSFVSAPRAAKASGEPTVSFEASGLSGAGFQNVVAVDPRQNGVVLSGGDVAGVHRSTDWGRTWRTSNLGMTNLSQFKVAALAFSPTNPDRVYAAVGHRGAGGGLLVSDDSGQTWNLRSNVPQFAGGNNGTVGGLPSEHPRSTGNLLAIDVAASFLYVATFDDGVMRSADDGQTWTRLGLEGIYLRSLAIDPANPNTLYASSYGAQVYKTTSARTTGSFTRLASSPTTVEELVVVQGRVYAAAGSAGVYRSVDGGGSWTRLGATDLRNDGPIWMSIQAYRNPASGNDVIVAGANKATKAATGNFNSLMRSTDGGTAWESLTADPSRIHHTMGGPEGDTWWLSSTQPWMMLGKGSYTPAHIAVNPGDPGRIVVAGRSGVWQTSDSGANWYPIVSGMGVTINRGIIADPNVPGRVFIANTDWVVLTSTDGLSTVRQTRPPTGNTGFSLALDTASTPSVLYVGVGERDTNTLGEVYSSADPTAGWVKEGLGAVAGGKRPLGVAVRRVNGSPVILAAVEGGGIWRKAGGSWSQVSTAAMGPQSTEFASFSWHPASPTVYLYDRESGVWRSNDNGLSWTRIWQKPSAQEMTGYVVADPADPSRLYASVAADGVYRLDSATSGTVGAGINPLEIGGFSRPGPLAAGQSGRLFVAEGVRGAIPASLTMTDDRGATWTSMADAPYRSAALFPYQMTAGPEGNVYLSLNGTGAILGRPGGGPTPDTTAPAVVVAVPAQDQVFSSLSVPFSGSATDDRGVTAVRVAVMDRTTSQWLRTDGTWGAWQQHNATMTSPGDISTGWSFGFNAPREGLYGVQIETADEAGNLSSRAWVRLEIRVADTTAPAAAMTTPTLNQVFRNLSAPFSGSATDNRGLAAVRVAVMNRNTNQWLRTDGTWGAWQQLNATITSPGATSTGWNYTFNAPAAGLYGVQVEALDTAGNVSSRPWVTFEVRTTKGGKASSRSK